MLGARGGCSESSTGGASDGAGLRGAESCGGGGGGGDVGSPGGGASGGGGGGPGMRVADWPFGKRAWNGKRARSSAGSTSALSGVGWPLVSAGHYSVGECLIPEQPSMTRSPLSSLDCRESDRSVQLMPVPVMSLQESARAAQYSACHTRRQHGKQPCLQARKGPSCVSRGRNGACRNAEEVRQQVVWSTQSQHCKTTTNYAPVRPGLFARFLQPRTERVSCGPSLCGPWLGRTRCGRHPGPLQL
jgi:hypothetical protein